MSQFLARVDKTVTKSFLEIEIDGESELPKSIKMVVLTGVKGASDSKDKEKKLSDEEHVAFHFDYAIGKIGEVSAFEIPPKARKIMY